MRTAKKPIPLTPEQAKVAGDNIGLVHAMMRLPHVRACGIDRGELLSIGQLVLCDCARLFKPELGFKFSTYACRSILTVFSREVTRRKRFRDAEGHPRDPVSLATRRGDLSDPRGNAPPAGHVSDEVAEQFAIALAALDDRERFVVVMRITEGATLKEVGLILGGLSKERVRQIQDKALAKCRVAIDAANDDVRAAA